MSAVLCIDDDVVAQKLYSILLKNAGYEVSNATNGVAALEMLETRPHAAVILDYMMPDMSGLELASRIRMHADEKIRKIPIIVNSASLDRKAIQQFATYGVRHFLVKPIEKEVIKQTLLRVVGGAWDGSAIQSLDWICHNMGIEANLAIELLQHASEQLKTQSNRLREANKEHNDGQVKTICSLIRSTIGNLGIHSDEEWMMDIRSHLTTIETEAENPGPNTDEAFAKFEISLKHLEEDIEKCVHPPDPAAPAAPATPVARATTDVKTPAPDSSTAPAVTSPPTAGEATSPVAPATETKAADSEAPQADVVKAS